MVHPKTHQPNNLAALYKSPFMERDGLAESARVPAGCILARAMAENVSRAGEAASG